MRTFGGRWLCPNTKLVSAYPWKSAWIASYYERKIILLIRLTQLYRPLGEILSFAVSVSAWDVFFELHRILIQTRNLCMQSVLGIDSHTASISRTHRVHKFLVGNKVVRVVRIKFSRFWKTQSPIFSYYPHGQTRVKNMLPPFWIWVCSSVQKWIGLNCYS